LTHQEGRNNVKLPSHDASWTGHSTAQLSMQLAALSPQLQQSQLLQLIVALRPVSAAHSSGTSPLAADRTPFHWTAALLYAAANIAGGTQ